MLEYMFDYKGVSSASHITPELRASALREQLPTTRSGEQLPTTRSGIHEPAAACATDAGPCGLPHLGVVTGLVRSHSTQDGEAYADDSPSLATALVAGPSQAGEWIAFVGVPDLGLEAAAQFGIDLDRTVVVPRPGELWLSVTAGLLDVAAVVVVKPPALVTAQQAERLKSRLRMKDAALVCWGEWPRPDATLTITESSWLGLGRGHGRLTARRVVVSVRQGGPVRHVPLWLPGVDQQVAERDHEVIPLVVAQAG